MITSDNNALSQGRGGKKDKGEGSAPHPNRWVQSTAKEKGFDGPALWRRECETLAERHKFVYVAKDMQKWVQK